MNQEPANQGSSGRDVFISYASLDTAVANSIVESLESQGLKCWMAPRDVKPGAQYADAIVRAINEAKAVVLVMSSSAVDSAHVAREVERAASKRKPMIPFRVDTAALNPELEYFLSNAQWIDVPKLGMPAALVKLKDAVGQGSASPLQKISASKPAGGAKKRIAIAAAVAVALGVAVGIGFYLWKSNHVGAQAPSVAAITDKSIAVLPFVDMSEKKDQEYFGDGMAEEIIDLLTKVPDLRVPARTSSFYFKGKPTQLGEIAKALNVAHVLEGSVRKSANALRITAHLIRVDSGYDVWSQSYDKDLKDIFQIQDEIATAVVQALKAQLLTNPPAPYRTANTEAYSLFLQGRYLNGQASEDDLRRATQVLQRAVSLDPTFAPAWEELAESYVLLAGDVTADPAHDMEGARAAVQRALALNPADAKARYLLATIKVTFEHDWGGAVAEMEAARRADPNFTEPVELVFVTGCGSGPCHEKFIRDISRDIERDPFNAAALTDRAYAHYYAGELEAAESDLRRAHEVSPNLSEGRYGLALVLIARQKPAEALPVVEAMPESLYRRAGLAFVYQALGRKAEADAVLQELLAKDSQDAPFQIAEVFAARGDTQSALDWLQRDYDLRLYGILDAKVDPLLKPLAREPRFIALMKKFAPTQ
jgi:TolB-like protein/Flp pilus assembly protein TadD